mmetsp:Transcript_14219/g.19755  ORF Transcript_14219/g.19755 Transcript_14219/m.19755 type:complete len:328 (-) Transcript_14219:2737-3720(-)
MPCFTVEPAKKLFRSVFKSRTNAILEDRLDAWAEDKLSEADLEEYAELDGKRAKCLFLQELDYEPEISLAVLRSWAVAKGYLRGQGEDISGDVKDGDAEDGGAQDGEGLVFGGDLSGEEATLRDDLSGASLLAVLQELKYGSLRDRQHIAGTEATVRDFCDFAQSEWVEVFPTRRIRLRKSFQRFLRDQGKTLAVDALLPSAIAPKPSRKDLEAALDRAFAEDDFDKAEDIQAQLSLLCSQSGPAEGHPRAPALAASRVPGNPHWAWQKLLLMKALQRKTSAGFWTSRRRSDVTLTLPSRAAKRIKSTRSWAASSTCFQSRRFCPPP